MKLIPAVDLREGRCVRLLKGDKDQETRYSDNPVEMAEYWESAGASRLHLVDLDGAFEEPSENRAIVKQILSRVTIPVQVGGGLRSVDAVGDVLDAGADAAIVGTAGIKNPELLGELVNHYGEDSIYASVDCKNGKVMVRGWEEASRLSRLEWAHKLEDQGVNRIIYTDVGRDGTEQGIDLEGTRELLDQANLRVIASGGIGSLDHLKQLRNLDGDRLDGVVVGRALYEEKFSFQQGQSVLEESPGTT